MSIHSIIGTTIYIGKKNLETVYGDMIAYTFQDLIHKGYIIALAHGNIQADVLYTRLHSSCVTSELMRSLDCDCVQQLDGAIKKICQGDGILFYLIQEGRGCGYVGKSRACMNVQYHEQKRDINTFEAYQMLGMQHDYRQYTNVKDILKILKINPEFILLTNNPDKIQKFSKLNMNLKSVQSIEVTPNPFNQQYLLSKSQYGHILYLAKTKVQKYIIPYERIQPFEPYSLPNCHRFVKVSSYYLPIKPVWYSIIMDAKQYQNLQKQQQQNYQLVHDPAKKDQLSYYVRLTKEQLEKNPNFSRPNWFNINVHYDIVTNQDYLVLKYGDCKDPNKVPVVRIHSQNLFNRFPLKDRQYKDRYKRTLDMIIRNGCGIILIFYNDGRGAGLGYYVMNNDINQTQRNIIGVEGDKRDYFGAMNLLKDYINIDHPIDILRGETSKDTLEKQCKQHNILVRKFINITNANQKHGILSVQQRIRSLRDSIQYYLDNHIDLEKMNEASQKIAKALEKQQSVYVTGIGSSRAHSRYLETLFGRKIKHIDSIDLPSLDQENYLLIVFSQGLSPNMLFCLSNIDPSNIILITAMTNDRATGKKLKVLESIQQKSIVLQYPQQNPDNTLIRITGPFLGYCLTSILKKVFDSKEVQFSKRIIEEFRNEIQKILSINRFQIPDSFIDSLAKTKNLIICCDSPAINLIDNIRFKLIEGAMINTHTVDYISFAHGTYQFIQNSKNFCVWFLTQPNDSLHANALKILNNFPTQYIHTTNYTSGMGLPFELQLQANHLTVQLIQILGINQLEWPGKQNQKMLYNIEDIPLYENQAIKTV